MINGIVIELLRVKVVDERVEVSEEKYGELVNEWEGKLGEAYKEYKKKQDNMEKQLGKHPHFFLYRLVDYFCNL